MNTTFATCPDFCTPSASRNLNTTYNGNERCGDNYERPLAQSTINCPPGLPNLDLESDPRDIHDPDSSFWDPTTIYSADFISCDTGTDDFLADVNAGLEETNGNQSSVSFDEYVSSNTSAQSASTRTNSNASDQDGNTLFYSFEERTPDNNLIRSVQRYVRSATDEELWYSIDSVFPPNIESEQN